VREVAKREKIRSADAATYSFFLRSLRYPGKMGKGRSLPVSAICLRLLIGLSLPGPWRHAQGGTQVSGFVERFSTRGRAHSRCKSLIASMSSTHCRLDRSSCENRREILSSESAA